MFKGIAFFLAAAALATTAQAQPAWPAARPITIIVPFSAGGSVDVTARLVGQKLAERLKQSVVVENVAGAGGTIGVAKAAHATPDGYTLLLGADSPIAIARLVNPAAVKYDPLKDLAPVGLVTTAPMVLVARPGLPANTLAEVLKLARQNPGQLSYATPNILARKMKGIAITDDKRLATLPDVPAVAETPGFKGFDVVAWTGLFAPAQTPAAVIERLNRELNEVLRSEEIRGKMQEQGAIGGSGSAAQFAVFVQREEERYVRIVKAANIKE